jgi:AcrR family transcriptional regulator/DNA-binding MarR family transcriptional regulator
MQRRRLLLAYAEVLAEHGLQGASVDRICKRAGVSRRTFYDLFLDREGCFLAAFELAIERIAAQVGPAYTCEGPTRRAHSTGRAQGTQRAHSWCERVRTALTALLELFDAEPGLARLCVVETLKGGPTVLERRRALLDTLVVAIDEGRTPNGTSPRTHADGEAKNAQPPPLTAEGTVGGVVSVIHTRLVERTAEPLVSLVNPLMSMIVHPYLGAAASARELECSLPSAAPSHNGHAPTRVQDPFKDLPIRITFRTARVLAVIGAQPAASNRQVGDAAGVTDQGQISKLLRRLERCGLVSNRGEGHPKGEPNAWTLTERGAAIQRTIDPPATHSGGG